MSNTKKTIQINPELFRMPGNKTRKAREKKELPIASIITPNNLKNKLLKRIKDHKTKELNDINKNNNPNSETIINAYTDEFSGAVNYLSDLSKKQKRDTEKAKYQANINSRTLKQYPSITSNALNNISLELPEALQENYSTMSSLSRLPVSSIIPNNTSSAMTLNYKTDSDVPYGCMKNGSKPTFRSWNQTMKNYEHPELVSVSAIRPPTPPKRPVQDSTAVSTAAPTINSTVITQSSTVVPSTVVQPSLSREQRLEQIKNKLKRIQDNELKAIPGAAAVTATLKTLDAMTPKPLNVEEVLPEIGDIENSSINIPEILREKKIQDELSVPKQLLKTTTSRKFTLGKSTKFNRVSVLLKDKKTRKNVIDAQKELKKTSITDVRKYLRQHGIFKVGTTAPVDILRKTFEASMLAGEITNTNKDTMLYNFINGEIPKD
jgi:hypothetical protein